MEWHREGLAVVGRLRNDRGEDLENIRVVVAANECRWKEATPDRSGLRPGQRTGFRLETFYCTGDDVAVYAQGSFEP